MQPSIERKALIFVQEHCKLSAHNCSKVLGVLLEFCDASTSYLPPCFCGCLALFEGSMKLKETATERDSLQAAYSFLK